MSEHSTKIAPDATIEDVLHVVENCREFAVYQTNPAEMTHRFKDADYVMVFYVDEEPSAFFGISRCDFEEKIVWYNCFWVWGMVTDKARGSGLAMLRSVNKLMGQHSQMVKPALYYSSSKLSESEQISWMKALGMEGRVTEEGVLCFTKIVDGPWGRKPKPAMV